MDLKQRRIELRLTVREVAEAVKVSPATISRWESGDIANMKRNKIAALARILKVSPIAVMGIDEENETMKDEAKKIIDGMTDEQVKAFIVMHGKK